MYKLGYNAILTAIANYIHEEDPKVAKYLLVSWLTNAKRLWGIRKPTIMIGDPLLKFWYTFILDNQERIKTNRERVYQELKENIYQFICRRFEEVCRLKAGFTTAVKQAEGDNVKLLGLKDLF